MGNQYPSGSQTANINPAMIPTLTTTPTPYLTSSAAVALVMLATATRGLPQAEVTADQSYQFPADAELYLEAPLDTSFTCEGLDYEFYADINNNCQVFHVCQPVENDLGQIESYNQWSFICGNTTVFDQATLTCNYAKDAMPCQQSPQLYGTVDFGKIEE